MGAQIISLERDLIDKIFDDNDIVRLSSLGGFSAGPPVALRTGDSDRSTTYSGVSGGSLAIQITNSEQQQRLTGRSADAVIAALDATVTSNRDSSNALKPIFNKQKIEAGFAIAGTLAREAGTFLAHRCQEISQRKERADELMGRAKDVSQALSPSERLTLRREAKQLNQQAAEQEQCWGPGGHYRQITTALLAAVGGNITAGTGVLVQAAAVNYLQQNLAKEVGNLVARGMLTEGSPFHASLHALIAAGGAAASGQDVVSAAGGSAAASLLTNLFEPPTPDSTEEEKTAKRHLLTTLIAGVAAATGGDVTAAHTAATANIDNNWLASQQLAQMHREFAEAETFAQELKVAEKWGCIAGRQTLEILMGAAEGLATVGLDNITGMVEFLAHPIEGVKGLSKLISEPGVASQIGEQLHDYLQEKLANITTALQVGGRENARQLGRDVGEVIGHVISAVTGACGAVKGCAALGKLGIKLGKQGVAAAKTLHTMKAGTAFRKVGEKVAQVPDNIAKSGKRIIEVVKQGLRPGETEHPVISLKETAIRWGRGIHEQGIPWEDYYASKLPSSSRLPKNFKTFDYYDKATGVATSAKTLDTLTPAKLANPQQIYATMKGKMIDPVVNFKKHDLMGATVVAGDLVRREIQLAIPYGTKPEQWIQINRGIQYAKEHNVIVEITLVKP